MPPKKKKQASKKSNKSKNPVKKPSDKVKKKRRTPSLKDKLISKSQFKKYFKDRTDFEMVSSAAVDILRDDIIRHIISALMLCIQSRKYEVKSLSFHAVDTIEALTNKIKL